MIRCGILVVAVGLAQGALAADCYDVSKGEPRSLTGTLDYVVFPGPPNYKDVQGGDEPEPNYVLRLPEPICLSGDEFADPSKPFSAVQVLESDDTKGQLRDLLHKDVTLKLKGPLAAETGHHHEPLVAWVEAVQLAQAAPVAPTVEYGSAASTVKAFYEALGQGQGEVASLLIAPERRSVPAFSAAAMTQFYGRLAEPIRLVGMRRSGPDAYVVQYRYATGSSVCNGAAVVNTSTRDGASYIDSIRALNGC